jgi:hypothetical protein
MSVSAKVLLLTALIVTMWAHDTHAEKKTVCTITVNSPDEKEAFRRSLPPDKYQFVELVERGRSDWLESACRQGIRCDVLVVSGHYDGGNEFFSDQLAAREFLPVDEMERVSCSGTCNALFSQLKEVYLFGCNTLNAGANRNASAEIGRSLVRSGHSRADAERLSRALNARHGESSRDRMRQVFKDVPAIYGFSSVAPLGPTAASLLQRHFQSAGTGEVGTGRASGRLLGGFAAHSMVVTSGLTNADPLAAHRQDICQFSDDRLSPAQKVDFVHQLLRRDMAEVRMFLERIEKYSASLGDAQRQAPEVSDALDRIARDDSARTRYLEFARDADQIAVRARMLELAQDLGWLTADEQRDEIVAMIAEQMVRNNVSSADVDQVCALNKDHALDQELDRVQRSEAQADKVPQAAILACLGSAQGHARVLRALTSPSDEEAQVAQVYLRHRPIDDPRELRAVTASVARMNGSEAKVRALETLARLRLSDRESLEALTRLYPVAESAGVQTAIAAVLIRADYRSIARPELVQTLREHRLKSGAGQDLIDVLIRRLQSVVEGPPS